LQDYCVKVLCRSEQIRQREAVASWMAKVLRTTLVDYYRRQAGERRGWDLIEARMAAPEKPHYEQWRCHLGSALSAMKSESKDLIGRIDLLGETRAELLKLTVFPLTRSPFVCSAPGQFCAKSLLFFVEANAIGTAQPAISLGRTVDLARCANRRAGGVL
jgi:hypothetical protein